MNNNLSKRIFTSIILSTILLSCLFLHKYSWLLLILIASIISFFEFNNLIKKIWKKNKGTIFLLNVVCLFYLYFFIILVYQDGRISEFYTLSILLICILTDIGGYIVGRTIGGKKLTKISPNKTISGSIGSFLFSLIPCFLIFLFEISIANLYKIVFLTLILSFISQVGDLFISYFKRKSKIKDTGKIIPGHGGILDRIDGMIFAFPVTYLIYNFFY